MSDSVKLHALQQALAQIIKRDGPASKIDKLEEEIDMLVRSVEQSWLEKDK